VRDDIGVYMVGEVETDSTAARAGTFFIEVRNAGNPGEIGKADRYRRGRASNVRRAGQRLRAGRWCEPAREKNAFGMNRAKTGMMAKEIVKGLKEVLAERIGWL